MALGMALPCASGMAATFSTSLSHCPKRKYKSRRQDPRRRRTCLPSRRNFEGSSPGPSGPYYVVFTRQHNCLSFPERAAEFRDVLSGFSPLLHHFSGTFTHFFTTQWHIIEQLGLKSNWKNRETRASTLDSKVRSTVRGIKIPSLHLVRGILFYSSFVRISQKILFRFGCFAEKT